MNRFDQELHQRLATIRQHGLYRALQVVESPQDREIIVDGKRLLNFSSNDYLGLANHPALKEAAVEAIQKFGAGSGASRLVCGSLAPHHHLEGMLASFKGTEAALSFSTGYATALGTITALMGSGDVLILDKLVHACIVDAAKLSGAKLRVFAHNDADDLEKKLKWADERKNSESQAQRVLIVTESIFSMDGDKAPLREIIALKEKYGAWLMLDEAHATGLFGQNRRGLAEVSDVAHQIEIQMGTLGKALGASGGYVCGSRALIDLLINRARSFIFSTAPTPAAAAGAAAGIRVTQSAEGGNRNNTVWNLAKLFRQLADSPDVSSAMPHSLIIPIHIGDENRAVSVAAQLRELGVFVPAIRYPTVARGSARLRATLTAAHKHEDVSTLVDVLKTVLKP